jgi:RNA polymerase sigma factor (sigma-70 family)
MINYETDKELAFKISTGDSLSWNFFIDKYSDYIISNIIKWCKTTCRVFNNNTECVIESIKYQKSTQDNNSCDEGLELYVYIFSALKDKVSKFQGKSSLKTYITACLRFIYNDYFISKYGKINIPTSLKNLDETGKKIYKILCRSKNIEDAIEKTSKINISDNEFQKHYKTIVELLKNDGEEKLWQHLYSNFSKNSGITSIENINEDGELNDYKLPVNDKDFSSKEIIDIFSKCYKELDSKYKRLLKLKFKDDKSIKDIFIKYAELFEFSKEQDVYSEIDKAIKLLLNEIRKIYQIKNESDTKEFKDSLYDIFQLVQI